MSNRTYREYQALEVGIKALFYDFAITTGGAGFAAAKTAGTSNGIASIERKGAGNYRITLQDKYFRFKKMDLAFVDATARDYTLQMEAVDVNAATPIIDFYTLTGGVATDLPDGTRILGEIIVKNSSVN